MTSGRLVLVSLFIGLVIGAGVVYFWQSSRAAKLEERLTQAEDGRSIPNSELEGKISNKDQQIQELQILAANFDENKDWLKNGRGMAYIKSVSQAGNKTSVVIDPALWLSQTDGSCTSTDEFTIGVPRCNPNGFLEINQSPATTSLALNASTTFSVLENGANGITSKDINFAEFLVIPRRETENPYWFEIESGKVMRIVEQYRP